MVSRLEVEPPAPVTSMAELMALAHAMELDAAQRYEQIGERMRVSGQGDLADVFERLARDERGHLNSVDNWAAHRGMERPDPAQLRWALPPTFDDEGIGEVDPGLRSTYQVLAMAVRNEERAFAFWTYVAAHAPQDDIRRAAEAMAHEELGHVATLRRARREAFHAARVATQWRPLVQGRDGADAATIGTSPGLAEAETRLAGVLARQAREAMPERAERLVALSREALDHARRAQELMPGWTPAQAAAQPARDLPDNAGTLAEWLVEGYLAAADLSDDEAVVAGLQDLAGRAISRLAFLRADLPAGLR